MSDLVHPGDDRSAGGATRDPQPALPSTEIIRNALASYQPTHIVAMVSGGRDSAAAYGAAEEMGLPVDLILHGNTRTGIPQTTEFVTDYYGSRRPDFAVADAGDAYERYVMRKGFFGKGRRAHNFSYRILKADPFRAAISRLIRQRKRGVRVMLLNGARKAESENRRQNLAPTRLDKGNLWVNIIHDWTADDRDRYLASREIPINPVTQALCRSGECMCGTMQSVGDRIEASALYPAWGTWLDDLESRALTKHGYGWSDPGPAYRDPNQTDLFEPMCVQCKAAFEPRNGMTP